MKTNIIRVLVLAGLASVIAFSSMGQNNSVQQIAYVHGGTDAVNLDNLNVDLSSLKNYVSSEKASRKILRYFLKHFENAQNVSWQNIDNNVLAAFSNGEITTRALFDKNGNLIYTIDYSDEHLLSRPYAQMIHSLYAGYQIRQVTRVAEAFRQIWVVKLETPEKILTVRIENNQPEEVENFQKSPGKSRE